MSQKVACSVPYTADDELIRIKYMHETARAFLVLLLRCLSSPHFDLNGTRVVLSRELGPILQSCHGECYSHGVLCLHDMLYVHANMRDMYLCDAQYAAFIVSYVRVHTVETGPMVWMRIIRVMPTFADEHATYYCE